MNSGKSATFFLFLVSSIIFIQTIHAQSMLRLPNIFGDHMVLQQDARVSVWGWAEPGALITIETGWNERQSATSKADSTWGVKIPTPEAGGPYTIKITTDDAEIRFENVLIGEVWLCSGQSNMEMPMQGWPPRDIILDSETEIANAEFPQIRLFTVTRAMSFEPQKDVSGMWNPCSPLTVSGFSATAYYFGKKLYDELNVPIGLIHSSWGGTPAEAWTNNAFLSEMEAFRGRVNQINESSGQIQAFNDWLYSFPQISLDNTPGKDFWREVDFNDKNCHKINFNDSDWGIMSLPIAWEESEIGFFDGVIWFRKAVTIPDNWLGTDLRLELGPVDDYDATYVNGERVGGIEEDGHWQTDRIYRVKASLITDSDLIIAVRVTDTRGGGGIYGAREQMKLINTKTGEPIPIHGEWKYMTVAEFRNHKFFVFGEQNNPYSERPKVGVELTSTSPTTLYNAMIAPLIPFNIKGAIWYQGESNAGRPIEYETLFPTMIRNWRHDWGYDFPFYFTQIAPFNYGDETGSQFLRDAQRKTLSLKNTGMAVTLDIGDNENIHPANKKDVGERLALWALVKDYDKSGHVCSGPLYKSMKVFQGKIKIDFDHVGDGLVLKDQSTPEFLIAGPGKQFVPAEARVNDNSLIVWSEKINHPVAVRYAWSNTAGAILFNKNGLPASSFRTDDWETDFNK